MASSDEDAPTPKHPRGRGNVRRGRRIPFLTFTEERSYPQDYDYTRVLDYFSDEDREESSHEEEEEEVGDDSDADASDDGDVGGGDGDDDGDSSDDDHDDHDGVDYGYCEDREFEKEQRGKQVRRAATGRVTRGRGRSRGRGCARGEGRAGGGGGEESVVRVLADVVQGGGRVMGVMGIFQGKIMIGLTMIPPPRKWSLLVTPASPVIGLHLPLDLFSCSSQGLC